MPGAFALHGRRCIRVFCEHRQSANSNRCRLRVHENKPSRHDQVLGDFIGTEELPKPDRHSDAGEEFTITHPRLGNEINYMRVLHHIFHTLVKLKWYSNPENSEYFTVMSKSISEMLAEAWIWREKIYRSQIFVWPAERTLDSLLRHGKGTFFNWLWECPSRRLQDYP